MPRPKRPPEAEMARTVAYWLRRVSADFERAAALEDGAWRNAYRAASSPAQALEQLRAEYAGWAAVAWAEAHGERLDPEAVSPLFGPVRVRAGHSEAGALWRERVLFVSPLAAHFRLPRRVPQGVLRSGVDAGHFPALVAPAPRAAPATPSGPYLTVLANKPGVLIDRATRSARGWNEATLQYRDAFEDGLSLNYFEENTAPEQLRQQLLTLDPRTSDVWRLLTAKALEAEQGSLFTPITIKPDELARALGLKPHPKGGMRGKDLVHCSRSLYHLERLWLTLPDARGPHEEGSRERVLAVMRRGKARTVDGQSIPSSWTVVLGEWAKYFPRSYAPIFRSLVELPANSATNLWAKQIGTELTYLIRETADEPGGTRGVTVQLLLARAGLLQDVQEMRQNKNLNRAVERFEGTLDLLGELGVHAGWTYAAASARQLERTQGRAEFFERWLSGVVEIQVPEGLQRAAQALVGEGTAPT